MQPTATREQVRQVDRLAIQQYGMSGLVLMENAGRGVVDTLCRLGIRGPVVVCCGKGNNAGDGFVIARHLELRGHAARVLLCGQPSELSGDAAANFQILAKGQTPLDILDSDVDLPGLGRVLADADWIVDALLGTGSRGEPRPPLDAVIDAINVAPGRRLAVDLPSGLDCDTGQATQHTVRAHHTCTFVAAKVGFFLAGAERFTGQVHVLDIGVPAKLLRDVLASRESH